MARLPNQRLVKILRSHTAEEVARQLGVDKNTIRAWTKDGLTTIDSSRSKRILVSNLRRFLKAGRKSHKQLCRPGEFYCLKCRAPQAPAEAVADYNPTNNTLGNLCGICLIPGTPIHRRLVYAKLDAFRAIHDIAMPQTPPRIGVLIDAPDQGVAITSEQALIGLYPNRKAVTHSIFVHPQTAAKAA
jgi:hypothetical protein